MMQHLLRKDAAFLSVVVSSLIFQVVMSSDEGVFGGWRNVAKDSNVEFHTVEADFDGRPNSFQVTAD
jgi:hypothetical protein